MLHGVRTVAFALLPGVPLLPAAAYAASWHPDLFGALGRSIAFWTKLVIHALIFEVRAIIVSPAVVVAILVVSLCGIAGALAMAKSGGQVKR